MRNSDDRERKNKSIALAVSVGIHALILVAFLFLMAWRAPNPPYPEYGIELNFGLDNQGGGEVQPEENVGVPEQPDETKPDEVVPEKVDEVSKVEETQSEVVTTKQESPVSVKEVKKEVEQPKKEEQAKETKVTTPAKEEPIKAEKNPTSGETSTSHGDDPGKQGDKGNPEGKLDAKALYGKQGGGGGDGFDLSMSGWAWASTPKIPKLPDNEDGRIVFEIECDEDGEIIGITTQERGLSPKAEQLLKDEIRKNSLIRTSGGKVPERSRGRVVFLLKSK